MERQRETTEIYKANIFFNNKINEENASNNMEDNIEEEDPDSGLVEDAFDVLPDEETLAFDIDLELDLSDGNFGRCSTNTEEFSDLLELDTSLADLDDNVFAPDTFQPKPSILPEVKNTNITLSQAIFSEQESVPTVEQIQQITNLSTNQNETLQQDDTKICDKVLSPGCNDKLKSFSKEQARQWRRKRILKTNEKSNQQPIEETRENIKTMQIPTRLKPLLPLPKTLKPLTNKKNLKQIEPSDIQARINPADKLANPLLGGERLGTKSKRGPIPMKLRALPESFWKEPNSISTSSLAGNSYAVLPPLFSLEGKHSDNVTNIRPVTPPDDKKNSPRHSPRSKKKLVMTSPPNEDLLFSLFDHLENKVDEKLIVKRGRPKKSTIEKVPPPPSCNREDDPCIVDDLATKLFPELTLHQKSGKEKTTHSNYAIIRIGKGNHTLEFPAMRAKDNYPAILNELVTHM